MKKKIRALFESFKADQPIPASAAQTLLGDRRSQHMLEGRRIQGHLDLSKQTHLLDLPEGMIVDSLDLSGCTSLSALPEKLHVRRLNLSGCTALEQLPNDLSCYELAAPHSGLRSLPRSLRVEYRLNLEGCTALVSLPRGLKVGSLILRECTALTALPEGLDVYFLDISGCTRLSNWPREASVRIGRLNARGCTQLRELPNWLTQLSQLDVSGCVNLTDLPATLTITSWLDLANTQLSWLPVAARGAQLRWRGVPIDTRIAFHPETITAGEVLEQPNAELRRVLLERMGYDMFLAQANAAVLDRDQDLGGERRLLKVALEGDEDLVCVAVICPSTGRQYLIRVPPQMRTCRQAVAWIAGFDKPSAYRPLVET